jgi:hypothetical protein
MKTKNFGFRISDSGSKRSRRLPIRNRQSAIRNRKGVLLLVILGMLTLFLMIGTAFIVSSNQFRQANKSYGKVGEQKNLEASQNGFLGEVINQIIRDTNNQSSVLRFHSLLRDMYGSDGMIFPGDALPSDYSAATSVGQFRFASTTTNGPNLTNGQIIQFQLPPNYRDINGVRYGTGAGKSPYRPPSIHMNGLNGRTVTFLDGPAAGFSTRIVGYIPDTTNVTGGIVRILNVPAENGLPISSPLFLGRMQNKTILISGRPFSGTGVGFNSQAAAGTPRLNAYEQLTMSSGNLDVPIALAPNAAFFDPGAGTASIVYPRTGPGIPYYYGTTAVPIPSNRFYDGVGGSDESYDAPDFQNMFLAWTSPQPAETGGGGSLGAMVLPSYHRPELINYWLAQLSAGSNLLPTNPQVLRKILLRPNWFDHPLFDGSNPEFAQVVTGFDPQSPDATQAQNLIQRMIYGPWDVDNDMDGVRDSIWIDAGLPVMVGAKGVKVKPLVAIHIVDMDGRLNVNAHGTRELAGINADLEDRPPFDPAGDNWDDVPKGQAFGVAEIRLDKVVGNKFDNLLVGGNWYGKTWQGRYGSDNETGIRNDFDLNAQLKMQGFPLNLPMRSNFGSLPDLRARYRSAMNDFGQFVTTWTPADSNAHSLVEDNPYETNIAASGNRGTGGSVDNPFSPAELERLLRAYDLDSSTLAPRLAAVLQGNDTQSEFYNNLRNYRALLTTDSYDVPDVSIQVPPVPSALGEFRNLMNRPAVNITIAEYVEYMCRRGRSWNAPATGVDTNAATLRRYVASLVAPEMLAGMKLDLNRPFGNGRDDTPLGQAGYGVVDEPGEFDDANNNGTLDADEAGAFWAVDNSRLSPNEDGNPARLPFEDPGLGRYHDAYDRDGNGTIDAAEHNLNNPTDLVGLVNLHNYRRQLLARHLYVLAMAMTDPIVGSSTEAQTARNERARQLAQWAINVVDFRDPDNIMTPFEYVVDPFARGWFTDANFTPVDGVPNPTAYAAGDPVQLVWGAEKPELVITETLAWHDRATNDLRTEDPVNDEVGDGKYQNHYAETINPGQEFSDTDFDQRFRPQGAAFIEIYNPNVPSPGASADTHGVDGAGRFAPPNAINNDGSDLGVDLARTHDNTPTGTPVWRILAYRSTATERTSTSRTPFVSGANPDTDPDDPDETVRPRLGDPALLALHSPEELLKRVARSIYFTNADPGFPDDGVAFYSSLSVPTVRPGRYMVVGSGDDIGGGRFRAKFGEPQSRASTNFRGIVLDANPNTPHAVTVMDAVDATSPVKDYAGFDVQSPSEAEANAANVGLVPNTIPQFASTASVAIIDQPRRFSLSEPAKGYPTRVHTSTYNPATREYSPVIDIPLDDQRGSYATDPATRLPVVDFKKWRPAELAADQLTDREDRLRLSVDAADGNVFRTIPGFSWIYLQRLANPMLPYDRFTNPYMTVDSSGANVTVFNGRASDEKRWPIGTNVADAWWKPLAPGFPVTDKAPPYAPKSGGTPVEFSNGHAVATFSSVQRGRENNPDPRFAVDNVDMEYFQGAIRTRPVTSNYAVSPDAVPPVYPKVWHNIWNVEQIGLKRRPVGYWRNRGGASRNGLGSGDTHWFQGVPDCTLGFMNEPFRMRPDDSSSVPPRTVQDRLQPTRPDGNKSPFSMITWHNRPFANPSELMLVPAYRGLLLNRNASFIVADPESPTLPSHEVYGGPLYDNGTITGANQRRHYTEFPYRNLLNFFRTELDPGADATLNSADDRGIAGLYRVLDLVTTSSLFVGGETWLNPTTFGVELPVNTQMIDPRVGLQPPFNFISSRREPGRVNINTVMRDANGDGQQVWHGVMHGRAKRNGGDDETHAGPDEDAVVALRRGYGTLGDDASQLNNAYPTLLANPFRPAGSGDLVPLANMVRNSIETTPMRSMGANYDQLNNSTPVPQTPTGDSFVTANTSEDWRNAYRNPYFRFSPATRLSTMTTNRSNVYAIWVTIGFFEVEEAPPIADFIAANGLTPGQAATDLYNRVYPDGYQFSKEAGIDTGEVQRVREFAIVDRTVPVAFEPGANHNTQDIVRLRRRIQE